MTFQKQSRLPDDAIAAVPDRFALITAAAHRARQLGRGADATLPNIGQGAVRGGGVSSHLAVAAMQELAAGHINLPDLQEQMITDLQEEIPSGVEMAQPDSEKELLMGLAGLK